MTTTTTTTITRILSSDGNLFQAEKAEKAKNGLANANANATSRPSPSSAAPLDIGPSDRVLRDREPSGIQTLPLPPAKSEWVAQGSVEIDDDTASLHLRVRLTEQEAEGKSGAKRKRSMSGPSRPAAPAPPPRPPTPPPAIVSSDLSSGAATLNRLLDRKVVDS